MTANFVHEITAPCSYPNVELSESRWVADDLYLVAMLDACASGAALLNEAGTILYVNEAWRELVTRHGLIHDLYGVGLNYIEICKQVSGTSVEEAAAIVEGVSQTITSQWVLIHAARLNVSGALRFVVTHEGAALNKWTGEAERKNDERLLEMTHLLDLGGRLINAQEEERKRIARELHDDLNQRMALLSIELEQLGQKIQKPRNLRSLVQSLQTKVQEISAEIHRISYRLHPAKLEQLGLATAVQSLCKELSESSKLKIEFHQKGFPATLKKDVSLCVFRIAQESLRNCSKHSGAHKARVVLENIEGAVCLTVTDDGCGFDTKSDAMKRGLGFTSMRERLRLVGGEMQIHSRPLGGTRIEISVPRQEKPGRNRRDSSQLTCEKLSSFFMLNGGD